MDEERFREQLDAIHVVFKRTSDRPVNVRVKANTKDIARAIHSIFSNHISFLIIIIVAGSLMMRHLGHSGFGDDYDTTFSNLFTIPIIKNLNGNIGMMQSTMTSVWIDLKTVPGEFAEISRLRDHIEITRVSLRSNRRENAELIQSLGEVEESLASIDLDEIHDPLAWRPAHSFALKKSIEKLEDMKIESGETLCYLETLLQDFKDSRTPLGIRVDEGFANWATIEMVPFLFPD